MPESDVVQAVRSLYKLLSSYRERRIQGTVKKDGAFCKKNSAWVQAEFQGRGGFVELGARAPTILEFNLFCGNFAQISYLPMSKKTCAGFFYFV